METPTAARPAAPQSVNTLIIEAGQAGVATSYWLSRAGVEHQLLERRETLGGAWQDRWDAFCLNTPNFSLALPGMPYDGPAPEAFMLRDDLIGYFRHYAESIDAPVRTGADVTWIAPAEGGGFNVATPRGSWRARNVVLATGGYQEPKIPALSAQLPVAHYSAQAACRRFAPPQRRGWLIPAQSQPESCPNGTSRPPSTPTVDSIGHGRVPPLIEIKESVAQLPAGPGCCDAR